jgi:hypothetical protein
VPLPGSAEEQSDVPSAGDNGLRGRKSFVWV